MSEAADPRSSKHMCGLQGFNPMLGDTCPACEGIGESAMRHCECRNQGFPCCYCWAANDEPCTGGEGEQCLLDDLDESEDSDE